MTNRTLSKEKQIGQNTLKHDSKYTQIRQIKEEAVMIEFFPVRNDEKKMSEKYG